MKTQTTDPKHNSYHKTIVFV